MRLLFLESRVSPLDFPHIRCVPKVSKAGLACKGIELAERLLKKGRPGEDQPKTARFEINAKRRLGSQILT